MPTVTITTITGPRWGSGGFTSSTESLKVGRSGTDSYYGRFGFPALSKTWYIKSVSLRMKRTDSYAAHVLKVGSKPDADWGTRTQTDFTQEIAVSAGANTKTWDISAHKGIMQGYSGTWYIHVRHGSGTNSYTEFAGGTGSASPRIVVEYEEATLSVPGGAFTIGSASTITIGTEGSGLTHKLSYSIGASSGVLNGGAAVAAGGVINWTPAAALSGEIKDSMAGTVTLTLESFLGGVLSSTILLAYPLNVPASFLPTINSGSTTFALSNPAGDTVGVYVQGRSRAVCSINASPNNGAPIREYRLTVGGKTYAVPAGDVAVNPFMITTDVLTAAGALTAVIEVIDSRGQKATLTRSAAITVNAYFAPMVTGLSLARATSDGALSNDGTYIKFTLTCAFAGIANKNPKAGSIRFKASGGSYSAAVSLNAAMAAAGATVYSFTITGVIGGGTIGTGRYVAAVSLADRYTTTGDVLAELASKKIYFDLHSSGEGVAVGKAADVAGLFDVGLDSRFDGMVSLGENGKFGNQNLVFNPTLVSGTAGWDLATNVSRDAIRTLNGCASIKSSQSGLAVDSWNGARPSIAHRTPCALGDVFTVSVYMYVENYATFDRPVSIELEAFDAAGTRVQYGVLQAITPTAAHHEKWTRLSGARAITSATAVTCCIRFYPQRNGVVWFACPKLERGPMATEFAANVEGDVTFHKAPTIDAAEVAAFLAKCMPICMLSTPTVENVTYSTNRYHWVFDFQAVERNDDNQYGILWGGSGGTRKMGFVVPATGFFRAVVSVALSGGSASGMQIGVARFPPSWTPPTINYATEAVVEGAMLGNYKMTTPQYSTSATWGSHVFDFSANAGDKIWPYAFTESATKPISANNQHTWASIQRIG